MTADALGPAELRDRLMALRPRYHDHHPFHLRMNRGELSREEMQRWVVNRFYYQRSIPLKDAAILSNCPEREVRRVWLQRIVDHDGAHPGKGGIESWLRLAGALGMGRDEVLSEGGVLPGVRYAVDAYLEFCRRRPWLEAVASSLTELFGPEAMRDRVRSLERCYPWLDPAGLDYFRTRVGRAAADARYALGLVLERCRTSEQQQRAVDALAFKCDLLWAQLDAIAAGETRAR